MQAKERAPLRAAPAAKRMRLRTASVRRRGARATARRSRRVVLHGFGVRVARPTAKRMRLRTASVRRRGARATARRSRRVVLHGFGLRAARWVDCFAQPLNRHRRHTRIFGKRHGRLVSCPCPLLALLTRQIHLQRIAFSSWRVGGIRAAFCLLWILMKLEERTNEVSLVGWGGLAMRR